MQIFSLVDKDGSEQISGEEVQYLMNLLGTKITLLEVDSLIAEYDLDGSGEVDLTEFLYLCGSQRKSEHTKADIVRAFDLFGKDSGSRPGVVGIDVLRKSLEQYGGGAATNQEIAKLLQALPLTAHQEFDYAKHIRQFI